MKPSELAQTPHAIANDMPDYDPSRQLSVTADELMEHSSMALTTQTFTAGGEVNDADND